MGLTDFNCKGMRAGTLAMTRIAGVHALLALTDRGHTEIFELHVARSFGAHVWNTSLRVGSQLGIRAAGLGVWRFLRDPR